MSFVSCVLDKNRKRKVFAQARRGIVKKRQQLELAPDLTSISLPGKALPPSSTAQQTCTPSTLTAPGVGVGGKKMNCARHADSQVRGPAVTQGERGAAEVTAEEKW